MAEPQYLSRAPIVEGLIDIRVELPQGFDANTLNTLYDQIKNDYPVVGQQRLFKGELQLDSNNASLQPKGDSELNGFIYRSADGTQVVQFRLDGFTFSRLAPYTSWEELYAEAIKLWHLYLTTSSPTSVARLAVRFINHLTIPTPFDAFADYLVAAPLGPENVSPAVTAFLTRLTINELGGEVFTDITQALASESDETKAVIYLDIDVYKAFVGLQPGNFEVIERTLLQLREIKNRTFFGSITERMVDLLK